MKLSFHEYLDKMRGCWNGKNIGGTLGTPFEGMRGLFDIQYYSQPLDKPLPNDDLDLQLVWLNTVEKYGRNINRELLGEYWLSFIYPDCAEYGAGKNNLRAGLVPPLSGYVGNHYRNSNGSWILTEIWACLCPGHPELAVKYAYEDAIIDHSYEGVYAAVFLAAIESAAFIISDTNALIDIGLSYLPEDSAIHKAVACARACYQSGLTWQQARKKLLQEVPSSFSVLKTDPRDMEPDEPVGPIGFDAPGHMGIIVMAWLYGEGDFDGIDKLEKELLAQNAQHKDWACTEELMKTTKDGKALYLHCLPADITGVSCETGEVDASVFDRYRIPLYKEASFKPYVIAAMIMLSKFENPQDILKKLEVKAAPRIME